MRTLDRTNIDFFRKIHPNTPNTYVTADIAVKCDICGDSKLGNKKRLHLYTKESYGEDVVHCFNCGYSSNMYNYIKNYHPEFLAEYKLSYIQRLNLSKPEKDLDTEILPVFLNISKLYEIGLKDSPEIDKYLKTRCLNRNDFRLILYADGEVEIFNRKYNLKDHIVIPLLKDDTFYGLQTRSTKSKIFYTYMDPRLKYSLKAFNYFNVNKKEDIYVFESIFDMLSSGIKNSIALLGSSIPKNLEQKNFIYCLDNQRIDETSRRETLRHIENNQKVFIWPKNSERFKDFNSLLQEVKDKKIIEKLIRRNIYRGPEAKIRLEL